MLASAYTLLENEHIRIDVIYGRWSRRVQHWIDLIGTILFLLPFTTVMLYLTWPALMRHCVRTRRDLDERRRPDRLAGAGVLMAGLRPAVRAGPVPEIDRKRSRVMRGIIPDPHQSTGPNEAANHEAGLMLTGRTDQTDEPERRP